MSNILDKIIADKKNSVERYKKSHPLVYDNAMSICGSS